VFTARNRTHRCAHSLYFIIPKCRNARSITLRFSGGQGCLEAISKLAERLYVRKLALNSVSLLLSATASLSNPDAEGPSAMSA
jgi:hypothetical protein